MNKHRSLENSLARLAASNTVYNKGERGITDGTGTDILAAILREVDDTILLRLLTFRADTGQEVSLVAMARRLLYVTEVNPSDMLPAKTDLLSRLLFEEDTALTKLMAEFASQSKTLTVTSAKTERIEDHSALGVSVEILAKAWSVDLNAEPVTGMQGFLLSCGGQIQSFVLLEDGQTVQASGHKDQIKELENLAQTQIEAIEAEFRQLHPEAGQNRFICVSQKEGTNLGVALACTKDQSVLIAFRAEDLGTLLSSWRNITKEKDGN